MARTRRAHRLPVTLSAAEHSELARRASAHGVPMAEFIRRSVLAGAHVQATDAADDWWHAMTPRERDGIYRWLGKSHHSRPVDPMSDPLDLGL